MPEQLRIMCLSAHPDDESLGLGGTLARYSAEGVATCVISATRGERGRFGDAVERPPLEVVGRTREAELRAAAKTLGVSDVAFLDYIDGDLDQAEPAEAIRRIVYHIRRFRPQVICTFAPDGAYGHPDHIAVSQFAGAAIVAAADNSFRTAANGPGALPPHAVAKLYYMTWAKPKWDAYQAAFKDLKTTIDGVERRATPWPEWMITTRIDTSAYWKTAWAAIQCHKTQLTIYDKLTTLPDDYHEQLWGSQEFYRAFSLVNGGRRRETDLFEGLRGITDDSNDSTIGASVPSSHH